VLSSLTEPDIPIEEEAGAGTLITFEEDAHMEQALVSGIAFNRDEAKITVLGVPDKPGIAFAILDPIAKANIEVDVIVQNVGSQGTTDFSFTVHRNDLQRTLDILVAVQKDIGAREVTGDDGICKLGLVGVGMRSHVGVASKMFEALAGEGVNIQMVSTSEIKITVVIDEKYMELAVRTLHKTFGLEAAPEPVQPD
jgi:aspartate kinase